MTCPSVAKAAELLVWSRRTGSSLGNISSEIWPRDLETGYAIQVATARLRGLETGGYKVGLTSVEAQRAAGVSAPIAGRLASTDILRSGARVTLPRSHLRVVEAEVVFEIGRGISPPHAPMSEADIVRHVGAAYAAIEICNSRLGVGDEASLAETVADNSNADLLVIGDPLPNWDCGALADLPVTLEGRGGLKVVGSTHRVLGCPVRSVVWLVNWLISRGESLKSGDLIASGSCTGMTEAGPDDVVVATFGEIARVTAAFELQRASDEVKA